VERKWSHSTALLTGFFPKDCVGFFLKRYHPSNPDRRTTCIDALYDKFGTEALQVLHERQDRPSADIFFHCFFNLQDANDQDMVEFRAIFFQDCLEVVDASGPFDVHQILLVHTARTLRQPEMYGRFMNVWLSPPTFQEVPEQERSVYLSFMTRDSCSNYTMACWENLSGAMQMISCPCS
jgi:hypothetical protein